MKTAIPHAFMYDIPGHIPHKQTRVAPDGGCC